MEHVNQFNPPNTKVLQVHIDEALWQHLETFLRVTEKSIHEWVEDQAKAYVHDMLNTDIADINEWTKFRQFMGEALIGGQQNKQDTEPMRVCDLCKGYVISPDAEDNCLPSPDDLARAERCGRCEKVVEEKAVGIISDRIYHSDCWDKEVAERSEWQQ